MFQNLLVVKRERGNIIFAKFYTNSMFIVMMLCLGSMLLSANATEELHKAAFIGATGLSAGLFTLGMTFAGRMLVDGNKFLSAINLNVWLCAIGILVVMATAFSNLPLHVFTDSVFENVVTGTMASGVALAMAFAQRKQED